MKRVYTAAHLPDAQMLVHALISHGVSARVFNENLQGGIGELPHVYPEVWIDDESDWDRARSLVGKFEQGVTPGKGGIRCPHCDEDNPATFEICWQCGTVIPPSTEPHGREKKKESD
jgi:hypothetical protein